MGAYLSKPITEKHSEDESNDTFAYGASSMQGWRLSQEDAHNAILNYDDSKAFFAVYDGHGGVEVAEYASKRLPDYLKNTENYKEANFEKALIEAFLGFDQSLLEPSAQEEFKSIIGVEEVVRDSDSEKEELSNLLEMAKMPLTDVLARYKKNSDEETEVTNSDSDSDSEDKKNSSSIGETSEGSKIDQSDSSNGVTNETTSKCDVENAENCEPVKEQSATSKNSDSQVNGKIEVNGDSPEKHSKVNGDIEKCGKGSGVRTGKTVVSAAQLKAMTEEQRELRLQTIKSRADSFYQQFCGMEDMSDDSDSDDDNETDVAEELLGEEGEEEVGDEEDLDEEDEEEDIEDEEAMDRLNAEALKNYNTEKPGYDSGCTACVALVHNNKVYCANVGDSRCVVCRDGKAIDLSVDHKPEDPLETDRILAAGGVVNEEGRVNGGLNLSRALGDHSYKLNTNVKDEEQMISPLPDIQVHDICAEDSFMVIACDGIWNSMSSQKVCDFVSERLAEQKPEDKLSSICEEMFEFCLAPDRLGDGIGCDNMTCIIVKFKNTGNLSNKRPAISEASLEDDTRSAKKPKAETQLTDSST